MIDLGSKKIRDSKGRIVQYEGELLDGDKATGLGSFTDKDDFKYTGHFVNDMLEGACTSVGIRGESEYLGDRNTQEWRENKTHGQTD